MVSSLSSYSRHVFCLQPRLKMADSNRNVSQPSTSKGSRKEYYAARDASKIYLHGVFPRWREFKEEHKIKTDKDVAEVLLDAYYSKNDNR